MVFPVLTALMVPIIVGRAAQDERGPDVEGVPGSRAAASMITHGTLNTLGSKFT